MLRPSSSQILKNGESTYSLVIGVAKRAREIIDTAYDAKEFANGEYRLVEDSSLKRK